MKKGIIFTIVKILACGIVFVNAIFGLFYVRGFYYFGVYLALLGVLCVLGFAAGIIVNTIKKRQNANAIIYSEDDEIENVVEVEVQTSSFEIWKLSKFAENLYTYVNYDEEADRIAKEGAVIKEDRDFYELAVIASLEEMFEGKSEEEIRDILVSIARKL